VAAVAALLESAKEKLTEDPQIVASIVLSTMAGVSRRMLEARLRDSELKAMQQGLATMVRAYLQTCAAPVDQ
ncbi:MAG TPA: TetR/AcrR family transcriptional regulator, partial [Edaphobacter sp.]